MADVINLNQYRKVRKRAAKNRQAAENRTKFGRDKEQQINDDLERQRRHRRLDESRLDDTSASGESQEPK